jgi:hypothetical protein
MSFTYTWKYFSKTTKKETNILINECLAVKTVGEYHTFLANNNLTKTDGSMFVKMMKSYIVQMYWESWILVEIENTHQCTIDDLSKYILNVMRSLRIV